MHCDESVLPVDYLYVLIGCQPFCVVVQSTTNLRDHVRARTRAVEGGNSNGLQCDHKKIFIIQVFMIQIFIEFMMQISSVL